MDGLTLKITSGNRKALSLAKTLVTTPMLINTEKTQGAVYAIPLSVESNQKSAGAEVSESLVITTDKKSNVADNIAPGSISWQLSGYIKGIPRLEPTNYYQPFVRLHTDILWNWRNSGAVLTFKDGDSQIYPHVVIKDLKTSQDKDCANGVPFTLSLKEINVMDQGPMTQIEKAISSYKNSAPVIGSSLGLPIYLGVTAAETIANI